MAPFEREMEAYLDQNKYVEAITLVNDGSLDNTESLLRKLVDKWQERYAIPIVLIHLKQNQGKGQALRAGVLVSESEWIVTMDADLAYSPHLIDQWVEQYGVLQGGKIVYIGSRKLTESQVEASPLRRLMSRMFSAFVYQVTRLPFADTQSGFKMYPGEHARRIFSELREYGFAHDVEVLMRLQKAGIPIKELPVVCRTQGVSSIHVLRDSWKMVNAILRIRAYVNE